MKRASRVVRMPPYPFARWARNVESARQLGLDIIRLDIGSPDLTPPDHVVEALCAAARRPDSHGYSGYRGIPALREAVAAYYQRRFGVMLDPNANVVPLIGSKEGIANLALACLDPGDLALVPDPGYASYAAGTALAGAEPYPFRLLPDRGYLPDLDAIPPEVADRAVMIWLNYPNNPTGATAGLPFFEEAVDYARRHGLLLCHDTPYCEVTYGDYVAPSLLQVPGAAEVAVEFNSLSKTANMAGWRVGMVVGNAAALDALAQVKSNFDSGLFRPVQEAAASALTGDEDWAAKRNALYEKRLDILVKTLHQIGFQAQLPLATFYIWARLPERFCSAAGDESNGPAESAAERFALSLLRHTGVAVAPGSFFGAEGECYLRFSATLPTERIAEAAHRLLSFAGDQ